MRIVAYLLMRFSEPSSYAGLGALLTLLGWNLPESVLSQLVHGLAAACALLALVLKDRGMVPAIALAVVSTPILFV
jgi:sulfite exporter TauE/SafE